MLKEMIKDVKRADRKNWYFDTTGENYNYVGLKIGNVSITYDYYIENGKVVVEKR